MAWIMGNQDEIDESLKNVAKRNEEQEERERKEREAQKKEGK